MTMLIILSMTTPARGWFQPRSLQLDLPEPLPIFPYSRKHHQDWLNANELLKSDKTTEALTLLQGLLDADEDSYLLDDQKLPVSRQPSLKKAARELLLSLPAEVLRQYETQYGAVAERLWDQYLQTGEIAHLEQLLRRYPVSLAGHLAQERLAAIAFDRNDALAASRLYGELWRSTRGGNLDRQMLALRLAGSLYRAGLKDQGVKVISEAGLIAPAPKLTIGGRALELPKSQEEIRPWLKLVFGSVENEHQRSAPIISVTEGLNLEQEGMNEWPLRGGTPTRNGEGPLGSPLWEPIWNSTTLYRRSSDESEYRDYTDAVWKRMRDNRLHSERPMIPTAQPIIVDGTVIFRSLLHLSAIDLASGRLKWETFEIDPAAKMLVNSTRGQEGFGLTGPITPFEAYLKLRSWDIATSSTLSSDGKLVYVLDDIGNIRAGSQESGRMPIHPLAPRGYNRLLAFEVATGKLKWEVGDDRGDFELDIAGAYFLGPPLPLNGRLYCLMKDGEEHILAVLNSETGEREWELSLVSPHAVQMGRKISLDGLSPSYAQGMIICPSDVGIVTAVDVVRREIAWLFIDPLISQPSELALLQARRAREGTQFLPNGQFMTPDNDTWLDGLPVIVGDRVLLALPESFDLYCLSLLDGEMKWSLPRDRGLFIAAADDGRVLVVSENQLQCYDSRDGSPLWSEPLALPSAPRGRGLHRGRIYQLPTAKQEILNVDLDRGRIYSRAAVPPDVELGNMIGARGAVVMQSSNSVTAFQSLADQWNKIEIALDENSDDADALALRGEILLSMGEEEKGLNDLRSAYQLSKNARARNQLFATLMKGLDYDFERYRKYRSEVEELMSDPQERWSYLKLYAEGLNRAGDKRGAYDEYLSLSEQVDSVRFDEGEDGALKVSPSSWIQYRLREIYQSAGEDDRRHFDDEIERRWETLSRQRNARAFANFTRYFSHHPLSWVAKKRLVDLGKATASSPQRELALAALADASDREIAGYAVAEWARLLMDHTRYHDCRPLLRRLDTEFADVECLPGETGSRLASAWIGEIANASGAEIETPNWLAGHIKVQRGELDPKDIPPAYYLIPFEGDPGPFFQDWVMEIDQQHNNIRARDHLGAIRWTLPLSETTFVVPNVLGNTVKSAGHLLVFSLTNGFVVVDTLTSSTKPRVLWQKQLRELPRGVMVNPGVQITHVIGAAGKKHRRILDVHGNAIGRVGPVNHSSIVYQVERELYQADIHSGEIRWSRGDIPPGSTVLGDEQLLTVIPHDSEEAIVLDALSGSLIARVRIPPEYEQLQPRGRHLLCLEEQESHKTLYLLDLLTGKNVWAHRFRNAIAFSLVDDDEVALVDGQGQFTLYRIDDGEIRFSHRLKFDSELLDIVVLRNSTGYVLLSNTIPRAPNKTRTFAISLESATINGPAYGFDRDTGEILWSSQMAYQMFDMNQPQNLPILTFACRRYELSSSGQSIVRNHFSVNVLDRRNGKLILEENWNESIGDVRVNPMVERQRIALHMNRSMIELVFTDEPEPEKKPDSNENDKPDNDPSKESKGS